MTFVSRMRGNRVDRVGRVTESEQPPTTANGDGADADDLPEQVRIRREKYDRLVADPATAPFPVGVDRTDSLADIRAAFTALTDSRQTDAMSDVA